MSSGAIVWTAVGVLLAALLVATVVQLSRAVREGLRIATRIGAYGDLPVFDALDQAARDADRVATSVERVPALVDRAVVAIGRIRGR